MLTKGQTLFFVPSHLRRREASDVEVTKVGRKWAQLSNGHRIDVETMRVDGGGYTSPGRCWVSREDYEREVLRNQAWRALRDAIGAFVPNGVSLEDIAAARALLKV